MTLCFTALITVVVSNSTVMDRVIARLQLGGATANALAMSPGRESVSFFRPLFGPNAIEECQKQCELIEGSGASACNRACGKLTLSEYARRITFPEIDPRLDADKIVASCNREPALAMQAMSKAEWAAAVKTAAGQSEKNAQNASSREIAGARLRYEQAAKLALDVTPPPQATMRELNITANMRRAACLRANYSLSEVGRFLAEQNKDSLSLRYYQTVSQLLRPATITAERSFTGQAQALMPILR